jgi:CubicO group peptidase (beta-lactamase class C family)
MRFKDQFIKSKPLLIALLIIGISCQFEKESTTPESVGLSSDTLKLAEAKMQAYIDSSKLAGIYTLVIKNGKKIHNSNYGFAQLKTQIPYNNKSIVRIFSMTKPVTAVALMTLFDEGKFGLDDKVSDFIPEFRDTKVYNPDKGPDNLEPLYEEITIRHLLTHTSGISYGLNWNSYVDSLYRAHDVSGWNQTLEDKMKHLAALPLNFQPGTSWEYGLSIDVAGYIVEILSGMSLEEFFMTRIFDPLKMEDTGFFVPEEKSERFVPLYTNDEDGNLIVMEGEWSESAFKNPVTFFSGGGGLVSTMDDYLKFCQMLLNGGELEGARILKESTVELIMSNQLPEAVDYNAGSGHGLGGIVIEKTGTYAWGGMASTNFWIDPTNEMIIITFAQKLPGDHSYAYLFRDIVYRSIIE